MSKSSQKPRPGRLFALKGNMQGDKRHNGFANYETWLVAVWISNDRKRSEYYRFLAKLIVASGKLGREERLSTAEGRRNILAINLRTSVEDHSPMRHHTTLYADLMNAALSDVDWYEVANELMTEFEEETAR